jgi:hypothetical protein
VTRLHSGPFGQFPPSNPVPRIRRWCSTHPNTAAATVSLAAFLRPSVLSSSVFMDNAQLMVG